MSTNAGFVTLMIITDIDQAPKTIRFSRLTYRLILLGLAALGVGIVAGILTYGSLLAHSLDRARLLAEVEELKRYNGRVVELEKNLANYRLMLKKMTDLAGIDLGEFGMATIDESDKGESVPSDKAQATTTARNARPHPIPQGYPVKGYVSRSYRPEDDNPKTRHFGIDLAVSTGTPVIATADGVVSFAGWDQTFGWEVVLTHANGMETIYGHNDSLLVQVGDVKQFGEEIAVSGNTGSSTAPHVHYEIRKDGNPVNPEDYLQKKN